MVKLLIVLIIFINVCNSEDYSGDSAEAKVLAPIQVSTVHLKDGQKLVGEIIKRDSNSVELLLSSGNTIDLKLSSIEKIEKSDYSIDKTTGEYWHKDPNNTRYLYSPNSFMLKKGEITFSQKELLFSSVGIGITDDLNLSVNVTTPVVFSDLDNSFELLVFRS